MKAIDFASLYRKLDEAARSLDRESAPDGRFRRETLAARARAIAGVREAPAVDTLSVLPFRVGGERYAVSIGEVDQVVEPKQIHSLPGVPRMVLGALLARSRVVPVIDLRQLLGLEGGGMSDLAQVIVVGVGDMKFAIAAHEVEGRLDVPRSSTTSAVEGPFRWVTTDRIAILDLDALVELAVRAGAVG